uniref:helix-turn-helix domain-containing protein n=1 Tax=Ruminococcus sp. TaxID=41978 RepID=UPI0030775EB1
MNSDFPMIISMLRRERRLSQKQVAADLGISQALLSHYNFFVNHSDHIAARLNC